MSPRDDAHRRTPTGAAHGRADTVSPTATSADRRPERPAAGRWRRRRRRRQHLHRGPRRRRTATDNTDTDSVGTSRSSRARPRRSWPRPVRAETTFLLVGAATMIAGGIGFRILPRLVNRNVRSPDPQRPQTRLTVHEGPGDSRIERPGPSACACAARSGPPAGARGVDATGVPSWCASRPRAISTTSSAISAAGVSPAKPALSCCCRRSRLARQTGHRPSLTGPRSWRTPVGRTSCALLLPRGGAAVAFAAPTLREMQRFPLHCASFRAVRRAPHDSV